MMTGCILVTSHGLMMLGARVGGEHLSCSTLPVLCPLSASKITRKYRQHTAIQSLGKLCPTCAGTYSAGFFFQPATAPPPSSLPLSPLFFSLPPLSLSSILIPILIPYSFGRILRSLFADLLSAFRFLFFLFLFPSCDPVVSHLRHPSPYRISRFICFSGMSALDPIKAYLSRMLPVANVPSIVICPSSSSAINPHVRPLPPAHRSLSSSLWLEWLRRWLLRNGLATRSMRSLGKR